MKQRLAAMHFLIIIAACGIYSDDSAIAGGCENPWGKAASEGRSAASGTVTHEHVQLCLPVGFVPENKEGGMAFSDPKDTEKKRGRLGLAVAVDGKYREPERDEEYEGIKAWLCSLANTSVGTSCSIVRLGGSLFVLLRSLEIGTHSESYFHMGNGYLLALSAEAPNEEALALLRPVIQGVRLP
jgi:hypothetical protein